jgi:hypothetical protein
MIRPAGGSIRICVVEAIKPVRWSSWRVGQHGLVQRLHRCAARRPDAKQARPALSWPAARSPTAA